MTSKTNEQEDRLTQPRFLGRLRGNQVAVTFMDGKTIKGELVDYDTYTLFIKQESGLEIAVFKHAVKYVCRVA